MTMNLSGDAVAKFNRATVKSGIRISKGAPTRDGDPRWTSVENVSGMFAPAQRRALPSASYAGQERIWPLPSTFPYFVPEPYYPQPDRWGNVTYSDYLASSDETLVWQHAQAEQNTYAQVTLHSGTHPDKTDMRAYCWTKYGLDIEDIRMTGISALVPQNEPTPEHRECYHNSSNFCTLFI